MRADAAHRGRQRIHLGDLLPGLVVRLVESQAGLLVLRDYAQPAPNVTAVGALNLARRRFLELLGTSPKRLRYGCLNA
jgi:hypothetical protein